MALARELVVVALLLASALPTRADQAGCQKQIVKQLLEFQGP